MKRLPILTVILVLFVGLSSAYGEVNHRAFDDILKHNVRHERIDYVAIRNKHMTGLTSYLEMMGQVDPQTLSRDEQLAFYINLYNATMIDAVCRRYKPNYSPADDDFTVFKDKIVKLNGKKVSLNHIENEIVRPNFNDPRIHAALVCGALSCPPILPRAYRADDLDEVLNANMKRWIAGEGERNRVDHKKKTLHLSSIFDWYADDFGGKANLANFVNPYFEKDVSGYKVQFIEYDWKLNIIHQ